MGSYSSMSIVVSTPYTIPGLSFFRYPTLILCLASFLQCRSEHYAVLEVPYGDLLGACVRFSVSARRGRAMISRKNCLYFSFWYVSSSLECDSFADNV